MLLLLASFFFLICLTAGIYLFGYAARRADALFVTALEIILGCIFLIPVILFADNIGFQELFTKPQKENWLWLGAAGIFGFIGGNFFSLINLRTAGERINSLLSPAITAVTIIAAVLIFNERITLLKTAGVIITLSAIIIFILAATKSSEIKQPLAALRSSAATVICITLTIICSIKGTINTPLSIMHSVWLRLLIALPFILAALAFNKRKKTAQSLDVKFYTAVAGGVIVQTIIATYLWFYCTYAIGISTFQIIIATLPFFVYAADVYIFKRTKPSVYFLLTALLAVIGIWLVM